MKWLLASVMIVAGLLAYYYFKQTAWPLRLAVGIVWALLIILILLQTQKGQKIWSFFQLARSELRKVAWPKRQETTQTVLLVIVIVVIAALLLWGIDSLFLWFVSKLTGQ